MIYHYETLQNKAGDALEGYKLRVVDSANVTVSIFSDKSGTAIPNNEAVAGDKGLAEFYFTPATGQKLQTLNPSGELLRTLPDFADAFVFNISQDAIDDAVVTCTTAALAATTGDLATAVEAVDAIIAQCNCDSPIVRVESDGWQALVNNPTDLALTDLVVIRKGFDITGTTNYHVDTVKLTKQVREVYPNNDTLTADRQALSDYIYSEDSIYGATNNSTVTSPKPYARWVMPSRITTASTCHWEISAAHRDARADGSGIGREIACVKVRANDGTTQTAWQTVSATSISTAIDDATSVEVYQGDLDISSLTDDYWLEGEAYPWFGGAASVEKSEDNETAGAGHREFTRRHFSKRAVPAYCYAASTGNDSTGSANATRATAVGTPCLTVGGALKKLHDLLGTGANALDGAEIHITDAVSMGSVTFTGSYKQQGAAGVLITRDPAVTRAAAQVTMSTSFGPDFDTPTGNVDEGALVLKDITFVHTAGSLQGIATTANLDVQIWNVDYNGSTTAGRSNSHLSLYGVDFTAGFGGNLNNSGASTATQVRVLRGVTIATATPVLENWVTVGCSFQDPTFTFTSSEDQGYFAFNNFLNTNSSTISASPANGDTLQLVGISNLFEFTGSDDSQTCINICSNSGNSSHVILHHNTFTGAYQAGRANIFYDGFANGGSLQTHELASVKGNIFPQNNYKGDVFNEDAVNIGYFPIIHGVGFAGNFYQFLANATTEYADYDGVGSVSATSSTVRNDPLFTDYQGSTNVSTTVSAGAGGGDYTLQVGSPARDILATPLLAFDIAGTSRGTGTQDAGAHG